MEIVVETYSKGEKNWEEFLEKVIDQIKDKTVNGVTENLECDFSSTDKFSRFLSTAMVMNTFKKYFAYTNNDMACGVQKIHMGGCLEDWMSLPRKIEYLRQFDVNGEMKKYVDNLLPVLDSFVETYKGSPDLEFWNNIYHERKFP
jgi:hypothetical protein